MRIPKGVAITAIAVAAGVAAFSSTSRAKPLTAAVERRSPSPKVKPSVPKPGSEKAVKAFMRGKLDAMRQVMRGIVTEDHDGIRKSAEKMKTMGTQVEWNVVQGPIYGNYSASFLRSADLLAKAAKDKSTDGAALVYMQMTLNCIECHRYTRGPTVKKTYRVD